MDQRQEILHEVAVLQLAGRTDRIVRLHEVYETPQEIAIVLELLVSAVPFPSARLAILVLLIYYNFCHRAAGGELQRVVDLQDGLQEVETVRVMRQILEGLIFLHDHNIAHLDLKVSNAVPFRLLST